MQRSLLAIMLLCASTTAYSQNNVMDRWQRMPQQKQDHWWYLVNELPLTQASELAMRNSPLDGAAHGVAVLFVESKAHGRRFFARGVDAGTLATRWEADWPGHEINYDRIGNEIGEMVERDGLTYAVDKKRDDGVVKLLDLKIGKFVDPLILPEGMTTSGVVGRMPDNHIAIAAIPGRKVEDGGFCIDRPAHHSQTQCLIGPIGGKPSHVFLVKDVIAEGETLLSSPVPMAVTEDGIVAVLYMTFKSYEQNRSLVLAAYDIHRKATLWRRLVFMHVQRIHASTGRFVVSYDFNTDAQNVPLSWGVDVFNARTGQTFYSLPARASNHENKAEANGATFVAHIDGVDLHNAYASDARRFMMGLFALDATTGNVLWDNCTTSHGPRLEHLSALGSGSALGISGMKAFEFQVKTGRVDNAYVIKNSNRPLVIKMKEDDIDYSVAGNRLRRIADRWFVGATPLKAARIAPGDR
jgi:hypothetical protein